MAAPASSASPGTTKAEQGAQVADWLPATNLAPSWPLRRAFVPDLQPVTSPGASSPGGTA